RSCPDHDVLLAALGETLRPAPAEPGSAERMELRRAVSAHFGDRAAMPAGGAPPRVVSRIPDSRTTIARLAPRLTGVAAAAVLAGVLATTPTSHLPEPLRTIARSAGIHVDSHELVSARRAVGHLDETLKTAKPTWNGLV